MRKKTTQSMDTALSILFLPLPVFFAKIKQLVPELEALINSEKSSKF